MRSGFLGFRPPPLRLHLVERRTCRCPAAFRKQGLDAAEAALEFSRRLAQRGLRIDIEVAGKISDREEKVAELILYARRDIGVELRAQLGDLFFDLVEDLCRRRPVEP